MEGELLSFTPHTGRRVSKSSIGSFFGPCGTEEVHEDDYAERNMSSSPFLSQQSSNASEDRSQPEGNTPQLTSPESPVLHFSRLPASAEGGRSESQPSFSSSAPFLSQDQNQTSLLLSSFSQDSHPYSTTTSFPTPDTPPSLSSYSSASPFLAGGRRRRSLHSPCYPTFSRLPTAGHQGRRRQISGCGRLPTYDNSDVRSSIHSCRDSNYNGHAENESDFPAYVLSSSENQRRRRVTDKILPGSPSQQLSYNQMIAPEDHCRSSRRSPGSSRLSSCSLPLSDGITICTPQPSTKYHTEPIQGNPEVITPSTPIAILSSSSFSSAPLASRRYSTISTHNPKRRYSSSVSYLTSSPPLLDHHWSVSKHKEHMILTPIKSTLFDEFSNTTQTEQRNTEKSSTIKTTPRDGPEGDHFVYRHECTPPPAETEGGQNKDLSGCNSLRMRTPVSGLEGGLNSSQGEGKDDTENVKNVVNEQRKGPLNQRKRRLSRVLGDIVVTLASSAAGLLRTKKTGIDTDWCIDTPKNKETDIPTSETDNASVAHSLSQSMHSPDGQGDVFKKRILSLGEVRSRSDHPFSNPTTREDGDHLGVHTPGGGHPPLGQEVKEDTVFANQSLRTTGTDANRGGELVKVLNRGRKHIQGARLQDFHRKDFECTDSSFFSPCSSSRKIRKYPSTPSPSRNASLPEQSPADNHETFRTECARDAPETQNSEGTEQMTEPATPSNMPTRTEEKGDAGSPLDDKANDLMCCESGASNRCDNMHLREKNDMTPSSTQKEKSLINNTVERHGDISIPRSPTLQTASEALAIEGGSERSAKKRERGRSGRNDEGIQQGKSAEVEEHTFPSSTNSSSSCTTTSSTTTAQSAGEETESFPPPLVLPPIAPPKLRRRRSSGGAMRASAFLYTGCRDLGEAATVRAWLVRSPAFSVHGQEKPSDMSGPKKRKKSLKKGEEEEEQADYSSLHSSLRCVNTGGEDGKEGEGSMEGLQGTVGDQTDSYKKNSGKENEDDMRGRTLKGESQKNMDSSRGIQTLPQTEEAMEGRQEEIASSEREQREEVEEDDDDDLTAAYRWLGPALSIEETKRMRAKEEEDRRQRLLLLLQQEEEETRRKKREEEERRKEEEERHRQEEERRRREEEERQRQEEERRRREEDNRRREEERSKTQSLSVPHSMAAIPNVMGSSSISSYSFACDLDSSSSSQAAVFPSSSSSSVSLASPSIHPPHSHHPPPSSSAFVDENMKGMQQGRCPADSSTGAAQGRARALPRLRIRRTPHSQESSGERTTTSAPSIDPQGPTPLPIPPPAPPSHINAQQSSWFSSTLASNPFGFTASSISPLPASSCSSLQAQNNEGESGGGGGAGMNVFAFHPGRGGCSRGGGRRSGARRGRR